MPLAIHNKLNLSQIVLAAFASALLLLGTSGSASACTSMACCEGGAASCCTKSSDIPSKAAVAPRAVPEPVPARTVARRFSEAPPRGCVCGSKAPVAPEPKERRAGENRSDPGRNLASDRLDQNPTSRSLAGPTLPADHSSQSAPAYLRTSRLLI